MFNGVPIGTVNYAYLNLSNVIFNGIPLYRTSAAYTLQGLNGANSVIANVSAYPYRLGLLVPFNTLNVSASAYNILILYFNQSPTEFNTFYYANYSSATANRIISPLITPNNCFICNTQENNYVVFHSGQVPMFGYLTPSLNITRCIYRIGGFLNQTCSYTFVLNQPYFVYLTNPLKGNITSFYTIPTATARSSLGQINISTTKYQNIITTYGIVGTASLTNNTILPYSIVLEPANKSNQDNYYMLSYNIGMYAFHNSGLLYNASLFNATQSMAAAQASLFCNTLLTFVFGGTGCRGNLAIVNVTGANVVSSNTQLIIVPAYSTSYVNSITQINATPKAPPSPPLPAFCNSQGWFCYEFRQHVHVNSWNYTFYTSAAYNSFTATSAFQNGASNVVISPFVQANTVFLKLTMPHYKQMGANCNQVGFDAYNKTNQTDYGNINYTILYCNATAGKGGSLLCGKNSIGLINCNATFILSGNATNTINPKVIPSGKPYYDFYVYWNRTLIQQNKTSYPIQNLSVNNTLTYNQWLKAIGTNNGISTSAASSSFFEMELNSPLRHFDYMYYTNAEPDAIDNESNTININCIGTGAVAPFLPPWNGCSGENGLSGAHFQKVVDFNSAAYKQTQINYAIINGRIYGNTLFAGVITNGNGNPSTNNGFVEANTSFNYQSGLNLAGGSFTWNTAKSGIIGKGVHLYTINITFASTWELFNLTVQCRGNQSGCILNSNASTFQSNTTIFNSFANSSIFGNYSNLLSLTSGNVTFNGITIPLYVEILIAVLMIIAIALSFLSDNEMISVFALVSAWIGNLFIAISTTQYTESVVMIIITVAYVIKNAKKWFDHAK